jgi:methionine synthase I (cobalamin-dependent)
MSDRLRELLSGRPWLLADGAMGTSLFGIGLRSGDAPEFWNTEHPDRITGIHRSFVDAGADIILTNSFGGTRHRLKLHDAEARVAELNEGAARIARAAADASGRNVVVAGSMGPTGAFLEPLGPLSAKDAMAAFAEQARALARGGVDVLWIESMSSVEENEAALAAANATGLPVVSTFCFDTNGRTMMGVSPADLARLPGRAELLACGCNCGVGAAELVACLASLATASAPDAILVAKANCGAPRYIGDAAGLDGTPELMAAYARLAYDAGARIIGGCCGTTADHLLAMKRALDAHTPGPRPDAETIEKRLGVISAGARAQLEGHLDGLSGAAPGLRSTGRGRRRPVRNIGTTD